ncbi:metallopeptidase family M24-domain-containing protein [Hypoxylon trugodes]|uniref:metallopeptidase family M24-domain-containing protein n=1 Tax=Hypoxylon trugodes TaxID=326681 RepID=UPI00218E7CEE|nr:metallopeptidase family M24-domain-containing protein [Hypoxylon trugodes]KAI1384698.1 metallopeptidase family M24-domain-containing protein [Hypoxylon trugodes]
MPTTMDHNAVRCRTRGLMHSAVSAAVAIVLSIPFMSKIQARIPLTQSLRSRSIEVNNDNVAELEAKAEEPPRKYPAKQHARKVAKELGTDNGLIYLPGQLESTWEDSDQGPPFRQRRYFYYLTGADFPGCSVTYDIAADKLTLWVPFTPPATVLWFGNTPSPEECLTKCDVHDVKYTGELPAYLTARLSTVKTLYALRPSQLPKFDGFDRLRPNIRVDVSSLQPAMDEARLIKSEYEVAMIRKAGDVSATAHRKVAALVCGVSNTSIRHSMKNECEIEAAFVSACAAANAKTQAYPVIAGSGANASTLHYAANNASLAGKQLVVLDAGAEWACYASEVTRTLPLSRARFSIEARAIYDLVHRMQEECLKRVKPGVVFRDLQLHATRVAVEGLLELGILKDGTADEIFKNGTGAAFFPHGLGHHVGLDVHDVLSRDLLRPAGEGMWGKRRPIGPQSVRAMVKQAASEAPPSPSTSTSSVSGPTQPGTPPLPPQSLPHPVPEGAARTPQPGSPASTPPSSPSKTANGDANGVAGKDKAPTPERKQSLANPPEQPQPQLQSLPQSPPAQLSQLPQILITAQPRPNTPQALQKQGQNGHTKKPGKKSSVSAGSKRPPHSTLQPGMVITIEPGLYFSKPYVEAYFLRRAEHAKYVDADVLDRYWGVGGVRVEDCVLVTETGCEVLTRAPKGAELLKLMGYA